jgi:hypothetical protein
MESTGGVGKYTMSFGLSLAVTSVLSALLVVVKELNENTVLALMKHITIHHWVTHGVFDLVVFIALGFLFAAMGGGAGVKMSPKGLIAAIVAAVAASALIIAGFYLIEG